MVKLQADPFDLQGNAQLLQGGSVAALQPAGNPIAPVVAPKTAPVAVSAPKPTIASAPRSAAPSAVFYRPDQNSQQVYNAQGQPLSYEQYIAQGGVSNFSNVLNQPLPGQQSKVQPMSSVLPVGTPTAPDPNQQLARSAAQAGLGLEDYLKLISGQKGVTPEERNQIKAGLGITDLENSIYAKPSQTTEDIYKNAYKSSGLGDLKKKIQTKLSEINTLQSKYTDKAGDINENPFLSEASRVGRLSILEDKRQSQIGNLQNELNAMSSLYTNGINEVNSLVTRVSTDLGNQRTLDTQKLQYLLGKAEEQISDKQSANSANAYAYLPDYLSAKAKSQKPDTIGSNESGYYRWNPETSTFEQVIAGTDKSNEVLSPTDALALGVPYGTTRAQAMGLGITPQKPATDAQNQAAGYATRVEQSGTVLDQLESSIANLNLLKFKAQQLAPNNLKSSTIQQYEQAARNFINSILRRESGAAIAPSEFENAYQQYLPYPGDDPTTLAQKKQNRDTVLGSLKQAAGSGYQGTGSGGNASDPLGLFNSVGNTSASTGMRTDRHNNPTAFTTDIAKNAGLVLGKDYTVGDPFPNNPNLHTAQLIGDPIAQTIKVIDRIGFYTDSGKPRWSYVNSIPQANNWSSLSYSGKANVIKQMYAHEGGTALLNNFA